jgi:hypothetical protein
MKTAAQGRRFGVALGIGAVVAAGLLALAGLDARRARAADDHAGQNGEAHASGSATHVARSICEAQELKALAAERSDIRVEIPPEYDKPYPSLSACRSHELAWDAAAPGPQQPIPFSHKHHAGGFKIPCLYCHSATDRSRVAGVPSVELCMGCHSQFSADYDQEFEGIRILKEHWGHSYVEDNGKWVIQERDATQARPIEWVQVHRLPEHVKFRHNRHVAAGVDCNTCHGNLRDENPVKVEALDKLHLVPDTRWWKYGIPTKKLEMGWCIQCHRETEASQDCLTCHH